MEQGKCIIFSAPSGAGKTTIVRHLLNKPELNLEFSISATTRPPRKIEREGKDYIYMSVEEFQRLIQEDAFVEWEEVYKDQFYGTLKQEISRIWESGKHVIFDVDVQGGVNLKKTFGDSALAIFVEPPSLGVLESRLLDRATENRESVKRRMDKAASEIQFADQFDYLLLNDELTEALQRAEERVKQFLEE
jgi:guanylate kinase